MASVGKKKASGMVTHSTRPIQHIRLSKSRQTCQRYFTSACPQPQYRNRGTNEINHRNSKITECSLGRPCAGTARTDAPRCRRFSHDCTLSQNSRVSGRVSTPILPHAVPRSKSTKSDLSDRQQAGITWHIKQSLEISTPFALALKVAGASSNMASRARAISPVTLRPSQNSTGSKPSKP